MLLLFDMKTTGGFTGNVRPYHPGAIIFITVWFFENLAIEKVLLICLGNPRFTTGDVLHRQKLNHQTEIGLQC